MPGVVHKKQRGLVRGPLIDRHTIETAVLDLRNREPDAQIRLEESVSGEEVLLSVRQDDTFGWAITVAVGGSLTELIHEALVLSPYHGTNQIGTELARSRVGELLKVRYGHTSRPTTDLIDVVLKLHRSAASLVNRFEVLEFNPVIVGDKVWAVDAVGVVGG